MIFTIEQAKTKMCPFFRKPCLTTRCMAFTPTGNYEWELNPDEIAVKIFEYCCQALES